MNTVEREQRVHDLGGLWIELMNGLRAYRTVTNEEAKSSCKMDIAAAREQYYSHALLVVLDFANKIRSLGKHI